MLKKTTTLKGYALVALDGEEVGKVKEFYFDDQNWAIRYLVADTGDWLTDRQVLISPCAITEVFKRDPFISINLTKKQIMASPTLGSDKPVSRQFEESYCGYYGWPMYWAGGNMGGSFPYTVSDHRPLKRYSQSKKTRDTHLRSTHEVSGYHIQALDGKIGHVDDFVIDVTTWAIRYLVVDTKNWWAGRKVLVSPQWIERVSWNESKVYVDLSREAVKQSPEYTAEAMLTRAYETRLHRHYDRPGYWDDEPVVKKFAGITLEEK